jgi:hypothetical protein
MKKYQIVFFREWLEQGFIEIEAEDEDEAREKASDLLNTDDLEIQWDSGNMDPGNQGIDSITELDSE